MMTLDDKAKAYDEAVEKAKKYLYQEAADVGPEKRAVILTLFPQLRELEMERIRQKCIAIISRWTNEDDRNECLSYLDECGKDKNINHETYYSWEDMQTIKQKMEHDDNIVKGFLMRETPGLNTFDVRIDFPREMKLKQGETINLKIIKDS